MTYSRSYKSDRYEHIADILTKVSRLEPGGRLVIKGLAIAEMTKVRSLLYDWLHQMGMKQRFRLKAEADRLNVIDLRLRNEVSLMVETPLTSREEELLMGELIENYENAEAVLECWVKEGKITDTRAKELKVKLDAVLT